jgi:hypothetical protein
MSSLILTDRQQGEWARFCGDRFAAYRRVSRLHTGLFLHEQGLRASSELIIEGFATNVQGCALRYAIEASGEGQNLCAIFVETSQSLGRNVSEGRGSFSSSEPNHNRFSFQHITERFHEQHFFHILVLDAFVPGRLAAILIFRGSSTSSPNLVQECNLSTTCVTVSTSGTFNQRQHKQGKHSWRRYLIAAPMLWLARAWC